MKHTKHQVEDTHKKLTQVVHAAMSPLWHNLIYFTYATW